MIVLAPPKKTTAKVKSILIFDDDDFVADFSKATSNIPKNTEAITMVCRPVSVSPIIKRDKRTATTVRHELTGDTRLALPKLSAL